MSASLFPLFLDLKGRSVLVVGGGRVATAKVAPLLGASAHVTVVAPKIAPELERQPVTCVRRPFVPQDLEGVWLVVAAAPSEVNQAVARAAAARHVFVNAVDDPAHGSACSAAVVRRGDVTLAISTQARAPALSGLLREGLEAVLPEDLEQWVELAAEARAGWKADQVPIEERRPLLLQALNALYVRQDPGKAQGAERGFVWLVGAGPGSPDHLTLKAARLLASADVVFFDALVTPEVLALAGKAQRLGVGKRAGRKSVSQEAIHRVMIRAARAGKRVVRLKCGDPTVLGRGGEEALALAAAGVPFELVPGLSSAIAAPELAGIPVTHRGMSSGFAVVSGHSRDAFEASVGGLAPHSLTLVVLMGLGRRHEIAGALIARGWRADTPAAVVWASSHSEESRWRGTLDNLAHAPESEQPGTLVIGDVVRVSEVLGQPVPGKAREAV